MTMIFFAGLLDNALDYGNDNPICIRGYDEAGNLLSKIRHTNPIPFVKIEYVPALDYPAHSHVYRYYFDAKDRDGNSITPYIERQDYRVNYGATLPVLRTVPRRIVATKDGEVFCFSVFQSTGGEFDNSALINGSWQKIFVDPFRIYNRDGYRTAAPDLQIEPAAFEVDQDGSFYVGGFYRNPNGNNFYLDLTNLYGDKLPGSLAGDVGLGPDVVRKYNRQGVVQWVIPGQSAVYGTYYDGTWHTVFDEYALDYVDGLLWDSAGYLYAVGRSQYLDDGIASSPSHRWHKATGAPVRVRKINPANGAIVWDNLYTLYGTDELVDYVDYWNYSYVLRHEAIIHSDYLYFCNLFQLLKINTSGDLIASAMAATESAVIPGRTAAQAYTSHGGLYVLDGKLFRVTPYYNTTNPDNLQIYNAADLSFISYRSAPLADGYVTLSFNNVLYTGVRYAQSVSNSFHYWHYRTEDISGNPVWAGANGANGPGLFGKVAGDGEGVNSVTGAPWPDLYTIIIPGVGHLTFLQFYTDYLRYTDAYGRTVGPDWEGGVATWKALSISVVTPTSIPSLAVFIALGLPTYVGDLYAHAPELPLRVLLGLPFFRREYVGRLAPVLYRATIGSSISLSIISLTARYSTEDLTISLVAGFSGLDQADALVAASGQLLTVYRGYRLPGTGEQMEPMISAPLTGIRLDLGGRSGSIQLTASQALPEQVYRTRTLQGIRWRGDRQLRCAVDTFLRPGDTAKLSALESWTVGSLDYEIGSDDASMQVNQL